jgi:biopolymer transport protein ExbB
MMLAIVTGLIWTEAVAQDSPVGSEVPAKPQGTGAFDNEGQIPREPYEVWIKLGPFRYPLALTSIIVVWFTIERLVVLRYGRVIPRHFVKRFFEHLEEGNLDPKVALKLCEDNGSPIALVLANGLR